jgi:branched-chain amino acid transport system permease protein
LFGIPLTPGDDGLRCRLRTRVLADLPHDLPVLSDPRPRAADAWVTIRLRRLPIGRAWEALREDEIACRSLGINTPTTKLTAFATGAMFGGFAGAFFARVRASSALNPSSSWNRHLVLAIVVLGGMGSLGVRHRRARDDRRHRCCANCSIFGNDFDPTNTACWSSAAPWC